MRRFVNSAIGPWTALGGSLLATLAAAAFVFATVRTEDLARFRRAVRGAEASLRSALDSQARQLRGAALLFVARPATPRELRDYAAGLDLRSVQGLGYARRFRRTETGEVESELQQQGFAGLHIRPDLGREERSAVASFEPADRENRAVIGFDMLTDPARREAMERARDAADVALTAPVAVAGETGFVLYLPVYRGGTAPATVTGRREALIGWCFSTTRAAAFFHAVFEREPDLPVDFSATAGDGPGQILRERRAPAGRLTEAATLRFGGLDWTLSFVARPALENGGWPAAGVLLAGSLVSGLLFLISRRDSRKRARAEATAPGQRTALEEPRPSPESSGKRLHPPRARKGRVLVVDDNEDAAMTLAEAVRLDGHEVRVAHDGPSALEQAAAFAPEVVLLDIGLPGLDGYEVARRLRRIPPLEKSLIVAVTGLSCLSQESDRQRALQAGFDEHLVKPADLDAIHRVLRKRLGAA